MLFRFDIKEVEKLYKHAHGNPNPSFAEPSFVLVVDHGVYLTSNGKREDDKSASELGLVVYAKNCNPNENEKRLIESKTSQSGSCIMPP